MKDLGSGQAGGQGWDREIDVERFRVQAVAGAEDLDFGELILDCCFQPLGQT